MLLSQSPNASESDLMQCVIYSWSVENETFERDGHLEHGIQPANSSIQLK